MHQEYENSIDNKLFRVPYPWGLGYSTKEPVMFEWRYIGLQAYMHNGKEKTPRLSLSILNEYITLRSTWWYNWNDHRYLTSHHNTNVVDILLSFICHWNLLIWPSNDKNRTAFGSDPHRVWYLPTRLSNEFAGSCLLWRNCVRNSTWVHFIGFRD